jgi:hypothetical protein
MSNPLCPQNDINRIPLFTCADYALSPAAYDPLRSIGQAIEALAPDAPQQQALKHLVELYPGMLLYGRTGTGYNPVLERFRALLQSPDGKARAKAFKTRVRSVLEELDTAFPGQYKKTKETLRSHLDQMSEDFPRPLGKTEVVPVQSLFPCHLIPAFRVWSIEDRDSVLEDGLEFPT